MHILEKCLMFVFCQRRRGKDQPQIQGELVEHPSHPLEATCPGRRILLEAGPPPSHRVSHSPAQLETISICADVHRQPDVIPEPRQVFLGSSKRHSGIAIEDNIDILPPGASLACGVSLNSIPTLTLV